MTDTDKITALKFLPRGWTDARIKHEIMKWHKLLAKIDKARTKIPQMEGE